MLGVHASASAIIQYGKIARKQGLVNVALDILSRIHTIPTVPIVDCFQKIRQQVKCYLQLAGVMGKNECMQVGCRVDPVPTLALTVRVPGPAPGSDDRERGLDLYRTPWSRRAVLPEGERDRKPLEYLNYMPRSLFCHILLIM